MITPTASARHEYPAAVAGRLTRLTRQPDGRCIHNVSHRDENKSVYWIARRGSGPTLTWHPCRPWGACPRGTVTLCCGILSLPIRAMWSGEPRRPNSQRTDSYGPKVLKHSAGPKAVDRNGWYHVSGNEVRAASSLRRENGFVVAVSNTFLCGKYLVA